MFDHLHDAVSAGKLNVVITCEISKLKKCVSISQHPLLETKVSLTSNTVNIKQEMADTETTSGQSSSSGSRNTQSLLLPSDAGVYHPHVWSIASKKTYNVKLGEEYCDIWGCCQLPSGEILLADDNNKRLKKLDVRFQVIAVCDDLHSPNDVCYIGKNMAVVSTVSNELLFIDAVSMRLNKTIKTEHDCKGVTCHGNKLYVTSLDSVYVYSTDGIAPSVLYTNVSFDITYHIAVSDDGSKLYITDWNKLIAIDSSGNHLSTFTYPKLSYARGVCVDGEGHVLVCDQYSGSILQISSDGKHKLGTIVNNTDSIKYIRAICFDRHKSTFIGAGCSDNVDVLQLK